MRLPLRRRRHDDWKSPGMPDEFWERQKAHSERVMDSYDEQPAFVRACIAADGSISGGHKLARAGIRTFNEAEQAILKPETMSEFEPNPLLLNNSKPPPGEERLTRKSRNRYGR